VRNLYNKFIIGIAVIVLGVVAGWYVMGGKGSIPNFPSQIKTPVSVVTPTAQPTLEPSAINQYRETNITAAPQPTGTVATKGGVIIPVVTGKPTPTVVLSQKKAGVSYTDNGFTPGVITVKAGTAVVFTNNSKITMWVASAVHPTHQELPGFDELKSVNNGGTYEYVFTKTGTWKYHNHMLPDDTGVVIVVQ
jgi:plastocyanin